MKQARQNAKHMKIAEQTIDIYAQSLTRSVTHRCPKCGEQINLTVPKTAITASHFDKMVRLIRQELGRPDSDAGFDDRRTISIDALNLPLETKRLILSRIREAKRKQC